MLLQDFDVEIWDKKDSENVVANHFSRFKNEEVTDKSQIQETFPDELLLTVLSKLPWYADFVNYLSHMTMLPNINFHQRKKYFHDVKSYL